MCDEAPVRGNATMRDIVPTHGNALTLDSILAENMIGAGQFPAPCRIATEACRFGSVSGRPLG